MMIEIRNDSAELFIKRHGPLPVCDRMGRVERMDTFSLDGLNVPGRAEIFYVLGRWRSREEFGQLLDQEQRRDALAREDARAAVAANGEALFDFSAANRRMEAFHSWPPAVTEDQGVAQDTIMASEIDYRKLRAFIMHNGPILASDKAGWVHKIDQDFPEGLLLLDRAREFFVFPTWHSRDEFIERLETDVPDGAAIPPDGA
jgi:hypothetical protein